MGKYSNYLENPHALLGSPVRIFVNSRVRTGILTEWSESSQDYDGCVIINRKGEGSDTIPKLIDFHGAVPYPDTARPDAKFQFVAPGEDESPIDENPGT